MSKSKDFRTKCLEYVGYTIDKVIIMLYMFRVTAAMLFVYSVQCKRDKMIFCYACLLLRLDIQK